MIIWRKLVSNRNFGLFFIIVYWHVYWKRVSCMVSNGYVYCCIFCIKWNGRVSNWLQNAAHMPWNDERHLYHFIHTPQNTALHCTALLHSIVIFAVHCWVPSNPHGIELKCKAMPNRLLGLPGPDWLLDSWSKLESNWISYDKWGAMHTILLWRLC